MKSHDLAKALLNQSNVEVIMQKDSEGNGYSPLAGWDINCIYVPENTYSGEVYSTTWTAEEACKSIEDWEELKKSNIQAVVLYPTN